MTCLRCTISGQVQGVFYRAAARHEAERRGISGYARNLENGLVEVLACGDKTALDELCAWLAKGPPQARVNSVSCEPVDYACAAGFSVE